MVGSGDDMTRIHMGIIIKQRRETFGKDVANIKGRRKLSQSDLWGLCQDAEGLPRTNFRQSRKVGEAQIRKFESGELAPDPAQRRILERVLRLQAGALDDADHEYGPLPSGAEPMPAQFDATVEAPEASACALASCDWRDSLGKVEPTIDGGVMAGPGTGRRFALPQDSDLDDKDIKALRMALQGGPRLIVLNGEPFLGKKAKIKGLLRMIAEPSDSLVYDLAMHGKPVVRLPIRAWSARRLHYRELVERVHNFLEVYSHARAGRDAPEAIQLPMPEHGRPLDELIESINVNFRNLPAVFIFTDVDAFGENHARNVVRDIGIEQLIRTLLDANKASRIIITTTDFDVRTSRNRQFVNFPNHELIQVDPPYIAEVKQFVRRDIRSLPQLAGLYDNETTVRGDDLVSVAAVINLTCHAEAMMLPDDTNMSIQRFLETTPENRDQARPDIYRRIVGAISETGLLHPVALIAASEDGVRLDSMRYLLWVWAQSNATVVTYDTDRDLDDMLENFAATVGFRFLRRTGIARYDPEEYDIEEAHSESDRVWEMDPIISMFFLDALRSFDRTLPAHAHRLIALIARIRSQHKKVAMRTPIGSRASEEGSRDIQCYVNLLASILFQDSDNMSTAGPPLRLSEAEVFSIKNRYSAARALRFAVFCLLKEDIDHDYRLTMVFDEDALRLDLYLLLFQGLGRVYTPEVNPLKLPEQLPPHLTGGIFSPEEVLDLLSTTALSAFHAQRFDIVENVLKLAIVFAGDHGIPESSILLSRLWCCKIDACIRRGSGVALTSHQDTLAFVRLKRREWYGDLAIAGREEPIRADQLNPHKAHLRLLVREAELTNLADLDRSKADSLYRQVESIEAAIKTTSEQHDPVVLSGRVGRRYIQFLLDDPAILSRSGETETLRWEIFDKVEALLSVNTSRLRRFSGADRVGVMVDIARLRIRRGDFAGAHHYAESAKRRAFSGSVSHGGKLDVFQVLAEVKLSLVERAGEGGMLGNFDVKSLFDEAQTAIRNLRSVAEHLGYAPSRSIAYLLEARAALAADARKRTTSDRHLNDALRAIRNARRVLHSVGQIDLNSKLDAMETDARARQSQRQSF